MNSLRNSRTGIILALMIVVFASGCKSKKKAMEAAAAKAKLEQEQAAARQKDELRKQEEERARQEEEARRLRESQSKSAPMPAETKLQQYFASIASSASVTSANNSINEALTLFASPSVPVFIVISEEGGQKDYDRPTNIRDYLNYLKDQKKNINTISDLKTDASGKITELELRKNY
ncbi:MAG: nucleoid-structuring protein H-NS [Bacteroidota bacterium]